MFFPNPTSKLEDIVGSILSNFATLDFARTSSI